MKYLLAGLFSRYELIFAALLVSGCSWSSNLAEVRGSWSEPTGKVEYSFGARGSGKKKVLCEDGTYQVSGFTWDRQGRNIHISEYIGDGLESVFLEYEASLIQSSAGTILRAKIYEHEFERR